MRALDFYQELFEKKSRQIVVGISREKIALHRIYGGTYLLAHFLGNFREKTKKVPTRTVSRKLPEIP